MINKELQDKQKKAWDLMIDKGLKMGEAMFIRSAYASNYKDEYPFIDIQYKKGEVEYYHSSIRTIGHYNFLSENEVILANAIYENTKEDFNHNTFVQELKFVFRVLGINSVWTD